MARQDIERRLAAIVSADVCGYSRMMANDETGTLNALKVLRRDLIDPIIAKYHGRIVKLMGDGALIEYASVVDAVESSVEVQRSVIEQNAGRPDDESICFRIGINLGDIIIDGDDIYGDGVNIAARLQKIADPDGISVRREVYNQVRDKLPYVFEDMGEIAVKNIPRPIHVFKVLIDGVPTDAGKAAPDDAPKPGPALPDKPSIAVLPFVNMSGRCRAGVLRRRHHRGHHHRAGAFSESVRDRPQLDIHLQGQIGARRGRRPRAGRPLRRRGQHPQGRQSSARHRPARRGGDREPRLGRALRPRADRHLRDP